MGACVIKSRGRPVGCERQRGGRGVGHRGVPYRSVVVGRGTGGGAAARYGAAPLPGPASRPPLAWLRPSRKSEISSSWMVSSAGGAAEGRGAAPHRWPPSRLSPDLAVWEAKIREGSEAMRNRGSGREEETAPRMLGLTSWALGIGVHSGRSARPGPSPKRPVLFEFRAGPARLNFGPCRAGPWASPSAHGPARNCLNVPGLFRAPRNYKSPKFIFWPEIQFLARNSH
jgi:hypothetical protein